MPQFGTSGRIIIQCDGGGADDSSEEEESVCEEEEETEESSEEDSNEDDAEEEETSRNVQQRSTRQSNPQLRPVAAGGSKGRMTRQKAREQMPTKRLLRSRKKSPAAGSRASTTPQAHLCQKCKRKFNTKQALALHVHWCQNQPAKKEEKKVKKTPVKKTKQSDEQVKSEGTPTKKGRGRPRRNPHPPQQAIVQSTPTSSKHRSQNVTENETTFNVNGGEEDFLQQRSPASSPGVADTSSESEYEQREFAANAHQLIQNRSHTVSIDVVNPDPEPDISPGEELMVGQQEVLIPPEGPVTCSQCKMTYRTVQGYQNHWGSCLAYSSDTEDEDDDEEVDVVQQSPEPEIIQRQSWIPPNVTVTSNENVIVTEASAAVIQDEDSSSSVSSTSEENDAAVIVEGSTTIEPKEETVSAQPENIDIIEVSDESQEETMAKSNIEVKSQENSQIENVDSKASLPSPPPTVINSTVLLTPSKVPEMSRVPTNPNNSQDSRLNVSPQNNAEIIKTDRDKDNLPLTLPTPVILSHSHSLVPSVAPSYFQHAHPSHIHPPTNPLNISQSQNGSPLPTQNQIYARTNAQNLPPSTVYSTTTGPILQPSNNTPTYTQAQLMPGTVLHNSVMQVPQQMAATSESSYSSPSSAVTSQQISQLPTAQQFPAIVYDPVTQQHVLRFPSNGPPQINNSNAIQNVNPMPMTFQQQQQLNAQMSQIFKNAPPADQRMLQPSPAQQLQPSPAQQLPQGMPMLQGQFQGGIPFQNANGIPTASPGPHYLPQHHSAAPAAQSPYVLPSGPATALPHAQSTPGSTQNNLMLQNPPQQHPIHQPQHMPVDPNTNSTAQFPPCPQNGPSVPYQCFPNSNAILKAPENVHPSQIPNLYNVNPNINQNPIMTNQFGLQNPQYIPNGSQVPYHMQMQQQQQQHHHPQGFPSSSAPQQQNFFQNPQLHQGSNPGSGSVLPMPSSEVNNGNPAAPTFPPTANVQNPFGQLQNISIPQQTNNPADQIQQQQQLNLHRQQQFYGMHPQIAPQPQLPPQQEVKEQSVPQAAVQIPSMQQQSNPMIVNPSYQWNKVNPNQNPNPIQSNQPHQQQVTSTPFPSMSEAVEATQQQQQQNPGQTGNPQQITQLLQYTDASGNTNTVILVTPPQNGNMTSNGLSQGVLSLLPGLQNITTQQPQLQQNSNCVLQVSNNSIVSPSPCSASTNQGQGRSGPCPCPSCKEKMNTVPGMEKYKKVRPYPSAVLSPNNPELQRISPNSRPIPIRPAGSKQPQKNVRMQKTGMLMTSPQPLIPQVQPGSSLTMLPLAMKTSPVSSTGQSTSFGSIGVVLENIGTSQRNIPLPNSNVAVVRPMENPLQKLTDQISQIESSFMTPQQFHAQHLQQTVPAQQQLLQQQQHGQGSPIPASIAPHIPQGPHLTLVTASPPPQASPIQIQPENNTPSQIGSVTSPCQTNIVFDRQPRLMLVDHGSPARLSSPTTSRSSTPSSTPTTPSRSATMAGVKRKLPPSDPGCDAANKSIKVTLGRKVGGDSYSIKGISGSARGGGTMKSLKIKGQIKSGEQAGTSTDVVVVPCIHLVPIPDPDAGEAEGNRTIAEGVVEGASENKPEDAETLSASVQIPVPGTSSDGETTLKMTHKAVVVYEVRSNDSVLFRSGDVRAVWGYIFETVQGTRLNHNLPPLFYPATNISLPQNNGQDAVAIDGIFNKLGLTHRAVQFLLEQLPGMKALSSTEFKFTKPPQTPSTSSSEEEQPLPENVSGCARTERFIGRKQFDMFGWLASKERKRPTPSTTPMEPKGLSAPISMRLRKLKEKADKNLMVCRSTIHGRGLFTNRVIEKSEMIIEYAGELIRPMVCDIREKYYESKSVGCYMFKMDHDIVIDATMKGNAARFINHSCEPNCEARVVKMSGKCHIIIFALRQILSGEELTYDYKFEKEEEKIPCTCGSKHCRKYLN